MWGEGGGGGELDHEIDKAISKKLSSCLSYSVAPSPNQTDTVSPLIFMPCNPTQKPGCGIKN